MSDFIPLATRYAFLNALPPRLQDLAIEAPYADLEARADAIHELYQALVLGELPQWSAQRWLPDEYAQALLQALRALEIATLCREDEELTLELITYIIDRLKRHIQLVQLPSPPTKKKNPNHTTEQLAYERALKAREAQLQALIQHLNEQWSPKMEAWRQLLNIFGELAQELGLGWDWSLGMLRSQAWRSLEQAHALVARMEPLRALLDALGRLHMDEAQQATLQEIITLVERPVLKDWTPRIPIETRGITRSDDLSRMMASESMLLRHPTLRKLWHTRRQERSLMSYLRQGQQLIDGQDEQLTPQTSPPKKRGPIILCVDTSGSMHGEPELIAKALALEAARSCHRQQRGCLIYMFSGPAQIRRLELDLKKEGLAPLLDFLTTSFQGGTEPQGPLERALKDLEQEQWRHADLLLITDGEFPLNPTFVRTTKETLERSHASLQGVILRNTHSHALSQLCDPVHHLAIPRR